MSRLVTYSPTSGATIMRPLLRNKSAAEFHRTKSSSHFVPPKPLRMTEPRRADAPHAPARDLTGHAHRIGEQRVLAQVFVLEHFCEAPGLAAESHVAGAPDGLAFDSSGNLYVANGRGNTIEKFTPGGVGSVFATGLNYPYGSAFDKAGNLFVSNYQGPYYGGPAIQKFTPEGVGSVFPAAGLADPAGIAFDSAGNLYVADQWSMPNNGSIVRFTPDGVGSDFASTFLSGPVSIAIQRIPEPSTLAQLVVGAIGLMIARRRK